MRAPAPRSGRRDAPGRRAGRRSGSGHADACRRAAGARRGSRARASPNPCRRSSPDDPAGPDRRAAQRRRKRADRIGRRVSTSSPPPKATGWCQAFFSPACPTRGGQTLASALRPDLLEGDRVEIEGSQPPADRLHASRDARGERSRKRPDIQRGHADAHLPARLRARPARCRRRDAARCSSRRSLQAACRPVSGSASAAKPEPEPPVAGTSAQSLRTALSQGVGSPLPEFSAPHSASRR